MQRIRELLPRMAGTNFAIMSFSCVYFLLPLYLDHVGLKSPATIGWILGTYYAASTIPRPFMAFLVERFSFRATLTGAALCCALGSIGLALSDISLPLLVTSRVLMGFGFGLFLVSFTTYLTMVIPNEVRGGAFALITIGAMAPFLIVIPLIDWILHNGFFGLFIWVGPVIAAVCALVGMTFAKVDRNRTAKNWRWGTYSQLFALPGARALFISVFVYGMTDAAIISISTLSMSRGLVSSCFMSSFAVGAIAVRFAGFRLMDVFPKDRMYPAVIAVTSLSLFGTAFSVTNTAFAFWGFLYGIGVGVGFPLSLAMIGDVAPPDLRPKATAMVWLILDGCFFITPVVMGYASSILGVAGAFRVIPGILFLFAPAVYFFLWKPLARTG
ncbi:MAG: MFS transporter [Thermovirgaceae bacterium]|nr:MFS transporter [Thermovirgaceae bacterium]